MTTECASPASLRSRRRRRSVGVGKGAPRSGGDVIKCIARPAHRHAMRASIEWWARFALPTLPTGVIARSLWREAMTSLHIRCHSPRRRGIQYAAASRSIPSVSGILDRLPSQATTAELKYRRHCEEPKATKQSRLPFWLWIASLRRFARNDRAERVASMVAVPPNKNGGCRGSRRD